MLQIRLLLQIGKIPVSIHIVNLTNKSMQNKNDKLIYKKSRYILQMTGFLGLNFNLHFKLIRQLMQLKCHSGQFG